MHTLLIFYLQILLILAQDHNGAFSPVQCCIWERGCIVSLLKHPTLRGRDRQRLAKDCKKYFHHGPCFLSSLL